MSLPAARVPAAPTDADLIRAYRGGDERGATELVGRHLDAVGRFLGSMGADTADLDDLVQETFIRAFRALDGWRAESAFRSWLMSIASNLLKDHYRRRRRRTMISLEEWHLQTHDDPAAILDATDAEEGLRRGLTTLPRLQREVFLLRAQQGLEYEEISRILETTPGAARVHYHNAVKQLKEFLA
jgi:RNA polymerase sigma-70 factor (ECF subfamily)